MSVNVEFYICVPFLCTPKFHAKTPRDIGASESKSKAHCHDRAVCTSCMHTTCSSMYFVKAAAVCTTSKKQRFAIWNAAWVLYIYRVRHVALPCFYSSPEWTNQTLTLENTVSIFHEFCSHSRFSYTSERGEWTEGYLVRCNLQLHH